MLSLKTRSITNSITKSLKTLRHSSPVWYLAPRSIPNPPPNPIRRFSTNPDPDPKSDWEITVPFGSAYVIQRNGKYLKILHEGSHLLPRRDIVEFFYGLNDEIPIRISTPGFESKDESWTKGETLGMESMMELFVDVLDSDLAFSNFECNYLRFKNGLDLSKDVEVVEILERAVSKIISEENIPRFIKKKTRSYGVPFKFQFKKEIVKLGFLDDLNAVITPRYGMKCLRLGDTRWLLSPALTDRLFGASEVAKWHEKLDKTAAGVKSISNYIVESLEEMKRAELGKRERIGIKDIEYILEQVYSKGIFEDYDFKEEEEDDEDDDDDDFDEYSEDVDFEE